MTADLRTSSAMQTPAPNNNVNLINLLRRRLNDRYFTLKDPRFSKVALCEGAASEALPPSPRPGGDAIRPMASTITKRPRAPPQRHLSSIHLSLRFDPR